MSDTSTIVEIRITNPKRAGVFRIGNFWDDETNTTRELKYANGNSRVWTINGNATSVVKLDISKQDDLLIYNHVKDHPLFVKRNKPLLEVTNVGEQTETKLSHEELSLKAKNIVNDLMGVKLANFSRICGLNASNVSEKNLRLRMFELSDKDPASVIAEWEDKDRTLKELLRKCQEKGLFKVLKSGVWRWKEHNLGINADQALEFLKRKENADLLQLIRKEVN